MTTTTPLKTVLLRIFLCICGLAALVAVVFTAWIMIRGDSVTITRTIIATVASPDGRIQAVLTRTDGGPSLDYGYLVDLQPVSGGVPVRVANLYAAQKSKNEAGVNLVWRNNNTLELQYFRASIARVENPEENVGGRSIATALKPQSQ